MLHLYCSLDVHHRWGRIKGDKHAEIPSSTISFNQYSLRLLLFLKNLI